MNRIGTPQMWLQVSIIVTLSKTGWIGAPRLVQPRLNLVRRWQEGQSSSPLSFLIAIIIGIIILLLVIIVKQVRQLAQLTVALNKFGRVNMFGPGTMCR